MALTGRKISISSLEQKIEKQKEALTKSKAKNQMRMKSKSAQKN